MRTRRTLGIMVFVCGLGALLFPWLAQADTLVARSNATGFATFEPTLGATSDGNLFYVKAGSPGVVIGFAAGIARSVDDGFNWTDVSPRIAGIAIPPETNDPYMYVDSSTGRVFQFSMSPILTCSMLSWSDDQGATWTTNPIGCGATAVWDHQTMIAAKPRLQPTVVYPNVLHQCVNSIYAANCSHSLDGGRTWTPSVPAYANLTGCGAMHGKLAAAPDGTVYLPSSPCGGKPQVAISRDDGLTWKVVKVTNRSSPHSPDPSVAVDDAGNVYYTFIDAAGHIWLSVSTDGGETWASARDVTPSGVTVNFPTVSAGAAGKVVLAYAGTADLVNGYQTTGYVNGNTTFLKGVKWFDYLSVSVDALGTSPTFQTVRGTASDDPLVRGKCGPGRCPGLVDFISVIIAANGRPYAAFVDACVSTSCIAGTSLVNNGTGGIITTLTTGPSLR